MQNRTIFIISKILIFVPLLIILLVVLVQTGVFPSGNGQLAPENDAKATFMLMEEVKNLWAKGQVDRLSEKQKLECSDLLTFNSQVGDDFYQCNPYFLSCLFKHAEKLKLFEYEVDNHQKYQYRPDKKDGLYFVHTNKNKLLVQFSSDKHHQPIKLSLDFNCKEVYLPENLYSAGQRQEDNKLWDNFGQSIYIDKYYVSNLDVYLWKKRKGNLTDLDTKLFQQKSYFPSTNLTFEEQKLFCADQGKTVLKSHYFDAASYLYLESKNKKIINKFPFHWTKKRTRELENIKSSDCYNIYSKECEKIRPYKFVDPLATSWMGMHFVLGNYLEHHPNLFEPELNIKKSSFYLTHASLWHEIGKRINDNELSSDKDFMNKEVEVAFRCMSAF